MWPFNKRLRLADEVKSITLPMASPKWSLGRARNTWDTQKAIHEGYSASAVVYACVEKRAKLIASVPWQAQRKVGDNWEHIPTSPLQRLIDNPNPDQSWYELMYEASQQLDLSGNAFISEIKGGISGTPFQLWLLPSHCMEITPGKERLVAKYHYSVGGRLEPIEPADMIQIKRPNPESPYFGYPLLKAAGRPTDVDRESGDWQKASLQNRSVLDLHVEAPEGTTPEQMNEVRQKLLERQASPANARKPIVTSGKVTQLGHTAVEMDFNESRSKVWAEICSVFGVPMAMLGFTESVNLANAEAMKRLLWQDTIVPELELIKRQLTHQLATEFGSEWRLEPDLSKIPALQEDASKKVEIARKLLELGYTTNEINEHLELGFDEIEDGNTRYEPAGLIPRGMSAPTFDDANA
jgi:HK97 family phage portal protein